MVLDWHTEVPSPTLVSSFLVCQVNLADCQLRDKSHSHWEYPLMEQLEVIGSKIFFRENDKNKFHLGRDLLVKTSNSRQAESGDQRAPGSYKLNIQWARLDTWHYMTVSGFSWFTWLSEINPCLMKRKTWQESSKITSNIKYTHGPYLILYFNFYKYKLYKFLSTLHLISSHRKACRRELYEPLRTGRAWRRHLMCSTTCYCFYCPWTGGLFCEEMDLETWKHFATMLTCRWHNVLSEYLQNGPRQLAG